MKLHLGSILTIASSLIATSALAAEKIPKEMDLGNFAEKINELDRAGALNISDAGEITIKGSLIEELRLRGLIKEAFASGDGFCPH